MPDLGLVESYYLEAFQFISPSRAFSHGLSGIRIGDCVVYVDVFGCPHTVDVFCRIIRAIDNAYISDHHKKQEQASKRKH